MGNEIWTLNKKLANGNSKESRQHSAHRIQVSDVWTSEYDKIKVTVKKQTNKHEHHIIVKYT